MEGDKLHTTETLAQDTRTHMSGKWKKGSCITLINEDKYKLSQTRTHLIKTRIRRNERTDKNAKTNTKRKHRKCETKTSENTNDQRQKVTKCTWTKTKRSENEEKMSRNEPGTPVKPHPQRRKPLSFPFCFTPFPSFFIENVPRVFPKSEGTSSACVWSARFFPFLA